MKELTARLVSVHAGNNEDLSKEAYQSVEVEPDGFVGDKHRGFTGIAASWDPEPNGTVRRNERQWSGVSLEEIAVIQQRMDLKEPLAASTLGANICIDYIYFAAGLLVYLMRVTAWIRLRMIQPAKQ